MSWSRRNKPRARQGEKLSPALRNKIIRRDRGLGRGCWFLFTDICTGLEGVVEVHHKIEVADGGTDDEDNLASACHNCHQRWSARQSQKRAVKSGNDWKRKPEKHPGILD